MTTLPIETSVGSGLVLREDFMMNVKDIPGDPRRPKARMALLCEPLAAESLRWVVKPAAPTLSQSPSVTAPRLAEDTTRAYFARTPRLNLGGGGVQDARRS